MGGIFWTIYGSTENVFQLCLGCTILKNNPEFMQCSYPKVLRCFMRSLYVVNRHICVLLFFFWDMSNHWSSIMNHTVFILPLSTKSPPVFPSCGGTKLCTVSNENAYWLQQGRYALTIYRTSCQYSSWYSLDNSKSWNRWSKKRKSVQLNESKPISCFVSEFSHEMSFSCICLIRGLRRFSKLYATNAGW